MEPNRQGLGDKNIHKRLENLISVQGRDVVCDNSSIEKYLAVLERPVPGLGLQITMILPDTLQTSVNS